jgi:tRNA dimethylallyltransferase
MNHKNSSSINISVIIGPTASGKSSRAIKKSEELSGEIINADSVQLYSPLPILSAIPTHEDLSKCQHHLYGVFDGYKNASAGIWYEKAANVIRDIHSRGKHPIIVGGTGFYISALMEGLSEIPKVSEDTKNYVDNIQNTSDNFHSELEKTDNEISKKINANDTQRIHRALCVFFETGNSLLFYQNKKKKLIDINAHIETINTEPDILRDRIKSRLNIMIKNGAIDEVEDFLKKCKWDNLSDTFKKTIGLTQIKNFLNGDINVDEMKNLIFIKTCQYAKRQRTWIRNKVNQT